MHVTDQLAVLRDRADAGTLLRHAAQCAARVGSIWEAPPALQQLCSAHPDAPEDVMGALVEIVTSAEKAARQRDSSQQGSASQFAISSALQAVVGYCWEAQKSQPYGGEVKRRLGALRARCDYIAVSNLPICGSLGTHRANESPHEIAIARRAGHAAASAAAWSPDYPCDGDGIREMEAQARDLEGALSVAL